MKTLPENRLASGRPLRALVALISFVCGLLMTVPGVAEEGAAASKAEIAELEQQLREAETAFAASFAQGDMAAFSNFLDEHAVFMGSGTPLKGQQAIVERWARMRGQGEPPFSWRPDRVSVEASGQLGMSTGPVMAADGTWVSSFVSTWKKTAEGWRVVLDVGPKCPPPVSSTSEE